MSFDIILLNTPTSLSSILYFSIAAFIALIYSNTIDFMPYFWFKNVTLCCSIVSLGNLADVHFLSNFTLEFYISSICSFNCLNVKFLEFSVYLSLVDPIDFAYDFINAGELGENWI